ncbi:MAG: hypothetical protein C4345_11300 [Chloroflexota bacterium]
MGIITLLVGALIGCLADLIVPASLPCGWISAIIAGLVGSWIGGTLLGQWRLTLDGLYIIPSLIGAIVFAFVVDFVRRALARGRTAEALSVPVVPPASRKVSQPVLRAGAACAGPRRASGWERWADDPTYSPAFCYIVLQGDSGAVAGALPGHRFPGAVPARRSRAGRA